MTMFEISQVLALMACLMGITAFQFKTRQNILIGWFVFASLNAAHFYVLGEYTAAILSTVTAIRFLVSSVSSNSLLMYGFIALSVTGFALTFDSYINILALTATMLGSYASFRAKEKTLRIFMMLASSTWCLHNILVYSPMAALMECLFLLSNGYGYFKHHYKKDVAST